MEYRPLRLALSCAIAFLLCGGAIGRGGYSLGWYRGQNSRDLTQLLRQLQVGQTTEADIKKIASKYGGKYFPPTEATQYSLPQPAHYHFEISSPYVTVGESTHAFPGLRLWTISAYLYVEDGSLASLSSSQHISRSDDFNLSTNVELTRTNNPTGLYDFGPYYVYEAHITGPAGERFGVKLSSEATADERRKAFDFNFSCLTQLRECRHVCEMMPSA